MMDPQEYFRPFYEWAGIPEPKPKPAYSVKPLPSGCRLYTMEARPVRRPRERYRVAGTGSPVCKEVDRQRASPQIPAGLNGGPNGHTQQT
jgi:hypothetical protein